MTCLVNYGMYLRDKNNKSGPINIYTDNSSEFNIIDYNYNDLAEADSNDQQIICLDWPCEVGE
jgi:hypothetical protein